MAFPLLAVTRERDGEVEDETFSSIFFVGGFSDLFLFLACHFIEKNEWLWRESWLWEGNIENMREGERGERRTGE